MSRSRVPARSVSALIGVAMVVATGCSPVYRADLINGTERPLRMVVAIGDPRWDSSFETSIDVAPGGRFEYRLDSKERGSDAGWDGYVGVFGSETAPRLDLELKNGVVLRGVIVVAPAGSTHPVAFVPTGEPSKLP
jgi:hypothetical protein